MLTAKQFRDFLNNNTELEDDMPVVMFTTKKYNHNKEYKIIGIGMASGVTGIKIVMQCVKNNYGNVYLKKEIKNGKQ